MNTQEKHDSDVATCRCCLLAETMRGCKACRFNVGLDVRDVVLYMTRESVSIAEAAALMADALDWDMQIAELRAG